MESSNNKYVAFIFETPVLENYSKWYAFDAFENSDYKISIADISQVVFKKNNNEITSGLLNTEKYEIIKCYTYEEIKKFIKKLNQNTIIFTIFGWRPETIPILKEISNCKLRYGYMMLEGGSLFHFQKLSVKQKIQQFFQYFSICRFLIFFMVRLPRKIWNFYMADFVIYNSGSKNMFLHSYFCDKNTRFLNVHSVMLEESIRKQPGNKIVKEKYCVFLDSYEPYHPDFKLLGINININPVSFYNSLRLFFSWIQQQYNLKVVVAAHPRSQYDKHPEAFSGYEVIKFKTEELVRDCEFAFMVNSTSYLYAIMYQKPLIVITMNALKCEFYRIIRSMYTEYLKKTVLNIDIIDDVFKKKFNKELLIDTDLYSKIIRLAIDPNYNGALDNKSYNETIISFIEGK